MKKQFDASWQEWIEVNIRRGCDKEGMARILLDNNFCPLLIVAGLKHLPRSRELIEVMNNRLAAESLSKSSHEEQQQAFQSLNDVYLPGATRIETDKAHIYTVDDFLSEKECYQVMQRIKKRCRPSTITVSPENDSKFRTSQTCDLGVDPDDFIQDLDRRIADYMGFESERSEGIQGQYYQAGNEFKTHTDYFEPHSKEYEVYAANQGQRTWTFMIYLNDVEEGGTTDFPTLEFAVKPKKGMAVIWNSLLPDGNVNPATAHWAKPIIKGEKYVITKWFRTHGELKELFRAPANRKIPAFTLDGFIKKTLTPELYHRLLSFYELNKKAKKPENTDAIGTFIKSNTNESPASMIELDDEMRQVLFAELTPMMESWVRLPLQPTALYGIREYQRGAMLAMHVDRAETHVISAIVNVDQRVNEDWPLYILDHMARLHAVVLQPGDVLLYESARLKHGRPEPLHGDSYANIFAHTRPAD